MPHAYTEDQLVEQPAIGLFAELGWHTVSALEETFGATGTLLRETKGEVVLVSRLRAALERLNPALPPEAITAAVDELTRDRSAMSLETANREVYRLMKEGIPVSVLERDSTPGHTSSGLRPPSPQRGEGKGGQTTVRVRVIDWEHPANNNFLLVSQFSVTGALYTCRPDLVCFVNGLPLVVIELKKPGVPARAAFDENLTHYKAEIPQLFWFNALLIASNGTDSRVGSLTADWERFFEWKRIEREDEPRRVSLEVTMGYHRGTLKFTPANHSPISNAVADIIAYHDRTKHQPERYANGPHGLDWASQPNPFRRFTGAPVLRLPLGGLDDTPPATTLFGAATVTPRPLTIGTLSLFLELSLGLSARKEVAGSSWYLRMNPSSGNLHPTEAYTVLPALDGSPGGAGLYHYAPLHHALEQRARWLQVAEPDGAGFHVALTSITWREAWKYGERAFRYCQHDVGHALAALRFAAAALGWRVQLLPESDDARLARLLGLDRGEDFADAERETPELLTRVIVNEAAVTTRSPAPDTASEWFGCANRLSDTHVAWPVIDEAIAASERKAANVTQPESGHRVAWPPPAPPACGYSAGQLIRQRRSAVDFDGVTSISRETLLAILDTTLPRAATPPFDAWPFPPRLHLVLFVHRVTGLEPGLYLWLRAPADADALRRAFRANLTWEAVTDSANQSPLYRLGQGDLRDFARTLSCHQEIAADSAFSLGMLARFEPVLWERGAAAYRELFWEAGMIGQALYLAAEAAGVRGTGIGCYFDDVLHRALGLAEHDWQSLYHFTVGGPVEDLRLRTAPPYAHLTGDAPGHLS